MAPDDGEQDPQTGGVVVDLARERRVRGLYEALRAIVRRSPEVGQRINAAAEDGALDRPTRPGGEHEQPE